MHSKAENPADIYRVTSHSFRGRGGVHSPLSDIGQNAEITTLPGPLDSRLPLLFRWRGSVIVRTWWQILLVTVWTTGIVGAYINVEALQFKFKPILISLMGVVCGLLLAFRSNSAYDRYWEGRKYWSTMTQAIRTMTRAIWINVKEENSGDIVEKKSAINLLIGFAFAMKHYLREEYDPESEDLLNTIGHIRGLNVWESTQSIPTPAAAPNADIGPTPKRASSEEALPTTGTETIVAVFPERGGSLETLKKRTRKSRRKKWQKKYHFKAYDVATPSNMPLELSYYIGAYINSVRLRDKCDSGTIGLMNSSLGSLVECLTGFERISRTPIPLSYSIHLHQSIWIYILALPFQLVPDNGWWTIPVVAIVSFFLLGILAIGWELENPFGYDDNDLPLDDYCKVLRREIELIVSYKATPPEDWVFKTENKPFAPECNLDAVDLASKSVHEILHIIANRGYKIASCESMSQIQPRHDKILANWSKAKLRKQGSIGSYTNMGDNNEAKETLAADL